MQLTAGAILAQGHKLIELKTGEGKTLSAVPALYLRALSEQGVHLVTVNDYLARRDAGWNAPAFKTLGLSVGVIVQEMKSFVYDPEHEDKSHGDERLAHLKPVERKEAYAADITYGTNNEFGFDYLRDNMVVDMNQRVQRPLHYSIVDEVDSILVDEARTPLIISGPAEESTDKYYKLEKFVRGLKSKKITDKEIIEAKNQGIDYEKGYDYLVDEKHRNIWYTEQGEGKFEQYFNISPEDPKYIDLKHHRDQAAKARDLFKDQGRGRSKRDSGRLGENQRGGPHGGVGKNF